MTGPTDFAVNLLYNGLHDDATYQLGERRERDGWKLYRMYMESGCRWVSSNDGYRGGGLVMFSRNSCVSIVSEAVHSPHAVLHPPYPQRQWILQQ